MKNFKLLIVQLEFILSCSLFTKRNLGHSIDCIETNKTK